MDEVSNGNALDPRQVFQAKLHNKGSSLGILDQSPRSPKALPNATFRVDENPSLQDHTEYERVRPCLRCIVLARECDAGEASPCLKCSPFDPGAGFLPCVRVPLPAHLYKYKSSAPTTGTMYTRTPLWIGHDDEGKVEPELEDNWKCRFCPASPAQSSRAALRRHISKHHWQEQAVRFSHSTRSEFLGEYSARAYRSQCDAYQKLLEAAVEGSENRTFERDAFNLDILQLLAQQGRSGDRIFRPRKQISAVAALDAIVNSVDQKLRTPLLYAVSRQNGSLMNSLLVNGARPDRATMESMEPALKALYSDGERQGELIGLITTPLLAAAWTIARHLWEQLPDAGADVNLPIYDWLPQFFLDDHGPAARRQWKRDREDVKARETGPEHQSTSLEAEDQQLRTPAERAISRTNPVSWISLQQPLPVVQRDHIRDDQLAAVRGEGELSKLHELRGQKDDTVMDCDGGTTPEVMALKCRFQSPELGQLPVLSLGGQSSVKTAEHAQYTECLSTVAPASSASSPADDLDWEIRAARRHRPHETSRRDGDGRRSHDRQSSNLLVKQNRVVIARSRSPSLDSLSSALSSTKHSASESHEQTHNMKTRHTVPISQSSSEDLLSGISPRWPFNTALLNKGALKPEEDPGIAIESDSTFYSEGEESFVLDPSSPLADNFEHDDYLDKETADIVQGLVKDFLPLLTGLATDSPGLSRHPSTSSGTASHRLTTSTSISGTTSQTCVSRVNGSRRSDDDEVGDGHRQQKRPRFDEVEPNTSASNKLLACPYAKHDPERYSERNTNRNETAYHKCASKILTGIPRLKQHLYRVHKRPEHTCSSCFDCFENAQSRIGHERMRSCEILECPFPEKMNPDQFQAVKRRQVGQDCVASWFAIFEILFSGDPLPDSPYVECTESLMVGRIVEEFTHFVEHEAPRRLAERMSVHLFGVQNQAQAQFAVNQALEDSLPLVLAEMRRQFQIQTETQVSGQFAIRTRDH